MGQIAVPLSSYKPDADTKPHVNRAQTGKDAVSVSLAATRHHLMFVEIDMEERFWEIPTLAVQQKF